MRAGSEQPSLRLITFAILMPSICFYYYWSLFSPLRWTLLINEHLLTFFFDFDHRLSSCRCYVEYYSNPRSISVSVLVFRCLHYSYQHKWMYSRSFRRNQITLYEYAQLFSNFTCLIVFLFFHVFLCIFHFLICCSFQFILVNLFFFEIINIGRLNTKKVSSNTIEMNILHWWSHIYK